jgi:ABC-type lipoprotein export system ATPase subunit
MLQTKDLKFAYNDENSFSFPDMNCEKGSHWLILGQSGCGKTTLLHLIGGLLKSQSGSINVNGTDMSALSESKLDAFRGKNIGIIFQQSHLIKSLNVEENLEAAQYLSGEKQNSDKVKTILERLNLGAKLKAKPSKLSQGEQQRVAIARALVNSPQLILADEPTSSLDDINCTEVVNLLLEQSKESGATLIIVTHDGRLKSMFENKIELTKKY